ESSKEGFGHLQVEISWNQRGFLSQRGSKVRRGVKEKQVSMADKLIEVSKHCNVTSKQVMKEKQSSFVDTSTLNVEKTGLNSYPPLSTQGSTPIDNSPGKSSYANVTVELSGKAVIFSTLFTLGEIGLTSMAGLNAMLKSGPWFIHNHSLILKKWNPDVNLLKEDVGNILVWFKLHGVLVMAFSEDGLSAISTKLAFVRHLEEIHVTWTQFEKKQDKISTLYEDDEELAYRA
nr:hypothetical protein [Tanacetum cinerariifolium]